MNLKNQFLIPFKFHNKKGFVHIVILTLLPVLLTILLGAIGYQYLHQTQSATRYICQKTLLQTQEKVSLIMDTLFNKINPTARTTSYSVKATKIAIAAALASEQWWLLPRLYKTLKQLQQTQAQIEKTQKFLIQSANQILVLGSQWTRGQVYTELLNYSKSLKQFFHIYPGLVQVETPTLAIEKEWEEVGAPYKTLENFSDRQAVTVRWSWTWQTNFSWLAQDSSLQTAFFNEACSATITKEDHQWIANLKRVKALQSF